MSANFEASIWACWFACLLMLFLNSGSIFQGLARYVIPSQSCRQEEISCELGLERYAEEFFFFFLKKRSIPMVAFRLRQVSFGLAASFGLRCSIIFLHLLCLMPEIK